MLYKKLRPYIFPLITLILLGLFALWPQACDLLYGRFIFGFIRRFYDILLSPFTVSISLVVLGFMLSALTIMFLYKRWKGLLIFVLYVISLFYWLWGFNYLKSPVVEQMELIEAQIDEEFRWQFSQKVIMDCSRLSSQFEREGFDAKNELFEACREIQKDASYLTEVRTDAVAVKPEALLLKMGILGIYFPYSGQAQYEAALGPIDRSMTMAHEHFHAAGVAPEFEADFLAYLACIRSKEALHRYSANMKILAELLFYYRVYDKEKHAWMKEQFSEEMKLDIEERKELFAGHFTPIAAISDEMIDSYLKMNGQEGLSDYHRLSEFAMRYEWHQKNKKE